MSATLVRPENRPRRPRKATNNGPTRTIRFQHFAPDAEQVFIAGTFNEWRPSSTPMIRLENGIWVKDLALDPGDYEYRFVVDGEWTSDLAAQESVENPFGTTNSRIIISPRVEL